MTVIEAVDRLNSWVRSDSASGWWSSPRHATYDWKAHLIERAIATGTAKLSAVHLMLNCRACGGDGIFVYDDGEKAPCRKCNKTGKVNLEFLVTEIESFTWHTPRNRTWRFGLLEAIWAGAKLSMDWEPNQKGRDLELWQVAGSLNVCEEAVARGELCKPGSHTGGEYEIRHDKYKLSLGPGPRTCEICGVRGPADVPDYSTGMMHGIIADHLEWSSWACNACQERHKGHGIFAALKLHPPLARMAHPEIQAWLRRRGVGGGIPTALAEVRA